jgi:hypothetical protein
MQGVPAEIVARQLEHFRKAGTMTPALRVRALPSHFFIATDCA